MFERTKITLFLSIAVIAVMAWFLGNYQVADEHGNAVSILKEYSYQYDVLIGIGIAIILAVSLNLVNGHTGQFSLGHAGFMGLGAYFASMASKGLQFPLVSYPDFANAAWYFGLLKAVGWFLALALNSLIGFLNVLVSSATALPGPFQFIAALLVGGIAAALAGVLVGAPSLRLKGDYLAIVTLGFNEIIRVVMQNTPEDIGGARGLIGIPQQPEKMFGADFAANFFWTFVFAAVTIYVISNLVNSTYGRGFLAVRDDEIAAESMGINTTKYKVLAFVTGAFFAGIGGGIYAHFKQYISPDGFNFMRSVDYVVMVILGGMGNTVGVVFAAVLLTILPELLRWLSQSHWLVDTTRYFTTSMTPEQQESAVRRVQEFFSNRMIFFSLILIVVMLARPQGLFTRSQRRLQHK
jgi:branched-chain amino acid transport system permease protein